MSRHELDAPAPLRSEGSPPEELPDETGFAYVALCAWVFGLVAVFLGLRVIGSRITRRLFSAKG